MAQKSGLPVYRTLQPEYNLYARQKYEEDLAPVVAKFGVGVIPYFSLAAGFLTGKYQTLEDTKGKARGKGIEKYFDERGMKILKALKEVADDASVEQATVALALLVGRPAGGAPPLSV